jgi:hypothetical protein
MLFKLQLARPQSPLPEPTHPLQHPSPPTSKHPLPSPIFNLPMTPTSKQLVCCSSFSLPDRSHRYPKPPTHFNTPHHPFQSSVSAPRIETPHPKSTLPNQRGPVHFSSHGDICKSRSTNPKPSYNSRDQRRNNDPRLLAPFSISPVPRSKV